MYIVQLYSTNNEMVFTKLAHRTNSAGKNEAHKRKAERVKSERERETNALHIVITKILLCITFNWIGMQYNMHTTQIHMA